MPHPNKILLFYWRVEIYSWSAQHIDIRNKNKPSISPKTSPYSYDLNSNKTKYMQNIALLYFPVVIDQAQRSASQQRKSPVMQL